MSLPKLSSALCAARSEGEIGASAPVEFNVLTTILDKGLIKDKHSYCAYVEDNQ